MADEHTSKEELITELRELRSRISLLEGQLPPEESGSSASAAGTLRQAPHLVMRSVEPQQMVGRPEIRGQFTETIDLSKLFTQDPLESGTFNIGSEIWATTFGKIVQALPISAFLLDQSSRITAPNQACIRISSDYPRLEGMRFSDLFQSSPLKERAQALVEQIFSDRKPRAWEATCQGADQRMWARFVFRPVQIKDERFLFVIVEDLTREKVELEENTNLKNQLESTVARRTAELAETNERLREEIGKRKEVDAALMKSEERFRELAELLPEHVFEVDARGFFTFSNRIGSDALGYTSEELEGRYHMLQVLCSEDRARALEDFKRIKSGEKVSATNYSLLSKDGSTFEVSSYITPILRDGTVVGARGVAVDISELKKTQDDLTQLNRDLELRIQDRTAELVIANEKLKEEINQRKSFQHELEAEKEKLAGILEAMEDGIYMVDADGNIQFINRALLRDLGPVEGRKCYQYFHDRSEPCSECHMGRVAKGKPTRFEWHCSKNGKTYELRDSAVRNADGSVWKLEIFRDITKQKVAEKALRDSERRYRELIENAADIVFETDANGFLTFVNAAGKKVTGLSQEAFIGKHYLDFVPQEYKKQIERAYGIQFVKRIPDTYQEYPMIAKDGKELWLGQRVHLVMRGGRVVGFQSICRDITERHRVEEELRKSEERFRELSDLLPQFVFEVDENLKFIFINRAGILESGYTEVEAYDGLSLPEFFEPADRNRLNASIRQIREGKRILVEEFVLLRKDKSTLPVITYASPIIRDGHFRGIRGVAVDITDRKQFELALGASEEKFRNLVERANDGIVIVQSERVTYANPAAARTLGYEYMEEIGEPLGKYVHPRFRSRMQDNYSRRMAGDQVPEIYDSIMIGKNGNQVVVEINAGVIDFSGEPADLIIMRDVTERRKIESQLEESELKFRSVVENAKEGITIIQDGLLKYVNPCALEIMGYSEDEMLLRPFLDFIHPEDRESVTNRYRRRLAGEGLSDSFLLRIIDRQGVTKWIETDSIQMEWAGEAAVLTFWRDVTERKKADEALKESEARFRALFENMINGVAVYSPTNDGEDFLFADMNRAAERIDLVDRGDVMGRSVLEMFPAVREFGLFEVFQRVWKTGITEHHPVAKYKDERIEGWRDNVVYRLPTGDIVAVYSDESERKTAEEARRESESRYRAIVDNAQDSIFLKDRNLKYTHVNPAMESLFGLPSSDLIGKTDRDLFGDSVLEEIQRADETVLRGRTVHEESTKPVQGIPVTFDVVKVPIRDSSGTVVGICGIARDVTEKRRAEEQVRQSQGKYRALFNNSRDGIYITTRDGQIEDANPAFRELFDIGDQDLKGLRVLDLYEDPKDRKRFQRQVEARGSVRDFELALRSKRGRSIDCLVTASVRRDPEGKVVGYEGSIRDVTDRKILQKQLFQAQKMEAIGTLAGGIAHDFNNILYAIIGFAELAIDHSKNDTTLQGYLSQVLKAGERAKFLVNQILTFSRQSEVERRPVLIGPIVKEVCKFLRASLPTTIEIRWNLEDDLAPVLADPTQIHQVLMNLCTNAGHAMRETGGDLRITLEELDLDAATLVAHPDSLPGRYQQLTIADTGHGIDRSVLDRVFDPYFTTKEKGEGTGLGLAVVHGIVKSLKGIAQVESEPGEGSVFRVYLPVVQDETPRFAELSEELKTGHECILVVDDEEPIAEMISKILGRLGYEVVTRTSSIEALELFRKEPKKFDLIITDMTMPNMTGKELTQRIREIRRDIPIILCTGFSELVSEQEAKIMGIQAFIMKPVLKGEMARTIRRILDVDDTGTI